MRKRYSIEIWIPDRAGPRIWRRATCRSFRREERARRWAERVMNRHTVESTWQLRGYARIPYATLLIDGRRPDHGNPDDWTLEADLRYVPSIGERGY